MSTINVRDALQMLQSGEAVLIDVRSPEEFRDEHIAYALSVPLDTIETGFGTLNIPPNRTILFHCLKGTRGQMACERVNGLGTCKNKILNIEGGIDAWQAAGLPVIAERIKKTSLSLFRQVQIIVGFLIALCVALGVMGLTLGFIIAGFLGAALFFAGLTGWCGLAMLLNKMPWNR